jgi:hypothetical protein
MSDDTKKVEALVPRPPEFDGTRKLDPLKAPTAGLVAMLRAARRAERERCIKALEDHWVDSEIVGLIRALGDTDG